MTGNHKKLLALDEETEQSILQHMKEFRGVGTTLESALGALVLGQFFGWRVLKILHNPATYRKYEKVLGIEFKAVCPEITEFGQKKVSATPSLKSLEVSGRLLWVNAKWRIRV